MLINLLISFCVIANTAISAPLKAYSLFGLCSQAQVQAKEWKQVIPLRTKRAEVERLFGKRADPQMVLYEMDGYNVTVDYVRSSCGTKYGTWNVPSDTVLRYTIYFRGPVTLNDFDIKTANFKMTEDPELVGNYYLINSIDGVMIALSGGQVASIDFYPGKKNERYRCKAKGK
jgi:hypothetical protein